MRNSKKSKPQFQRSQHHRSQSETAVKNSHQSTKRGSALEPLLHSEHIVTIEKLAVGGAGIARIEFEAKPLVVFVEKSAPQDQLKIKITSAEKNFLIGEIVEIIKASPFRKTPECKHFNDCGGCSWQHLQLSEQINQKELILKDLFKKFLPNVEAKLLETVYVKEHSFAYRNRIQLKHLDQQIGFFKPESHDIVDIENCLIAELPLQNWFKTEKQKLKPTDRLKKYELKINENDKLEFYPIGIKSEGVSFSQINRFINEKLVHATLELVKNKNYQFITEFYAGSGNFTFALANQFKKSHIEAIELNADLTRHAVEKLKNLKLQKQIKFFTTKAELFPLRNKISNEFIFLDPPRQGCEASLLEAVANEQPNDLLYISCHPVSLVRDLQKLLQLGYKFQINHLQIFDMFPQTDHFETLCFITKA